MNVWMSVLLVVTTTTTAVHGVDWCKDKLDRCAQRTGGFNYLLGSQPVFQWVANLILIDPKDAPDICRDTKFYVNSLTCIRNVLKQHVCWSQAKYWYADRYIPEQKTLEKSLETFCEESKRAQKVNMQNCMILNIRETRKKDDCLEKFSKQVKDKYGETINDRSMCSFFHKRLNCYRNYFGSICKTTLQENVQVYDAITMEEYFDPLRKSSICHITESASGVQVGFVAMLLCLVAHWFL